MLVARTKQKNMQQSACVGSEAVIFLRGRKRRWVGEKEKERE